MTKPYEETMIGAGASTRRDIDPHTSLRIVLDDVISASPLPTTDTVVFGRGIDAQIIVAHPSVSRRHAALRRAPGAGFVLEDLGSANGTVVALERIAAPTPVRVGEPFALGAAVLCLFDGASYEHPTRVTGASDLLNAVARAGHAGATDAHVVRFEGPPAIVDVVEALLLGRDILGVLADGTLVAVVVDRAADVVDLVLEMLAVHFDRLGVAVESTVVARARVADLPDALGDLLGAGAEMPSRRPESTEGASGSMRAVYELVDEVAASPTSVLLLGETGAGKEVLARRIHAKSPRRDKAFVGLNCAAFTETLLESELFGHEKGAFTGAVAAKPGLIEQADGGTLFLDELGEMPLVTQAKLLRVLEERTVLRVGGLKPRPVDLRLIAATNRNLKEDVASGRFRADLLYRVNAIEVRIPPLRERLDELPALVAHFVGHAARALSRPPPVVSDAAMALFRTYAWPGNVRELRNVIERAVLLARNGPVLPHHLPEDLRPTRASVPSRGTTMVDTRELRVTAPPSSGAPISQTLTFDVPAPELPGSGLTGELEAMEKARILEALEKCAGNQTRAAAMLGITRRVLISRIERYGIARPRR